MKIGRGKRLRKILRFYQTHMNVRPPYKVIIDKEFNLVHLLHTILTDGDHHVFSTRCCNRTDSTKELKCRHSDDVENKPENDCILDLLAFVKEHKPQDCYVVAVQDIELRKAIRKRFPQVPILYSNASHVLVMEQPSSTATAIIQDKLEEDLGPASASTNQPSSTPQTKLKKRKKNPNPLSVLKKKPRNIQQQPKKKKTRSRSKSARETPSL